MEKLIFNDIVGYINHNLKINYAHACEGGKDYEVITFIKGSPELDIEPKLVFDEGQTMVQVHHGIKPYLLHYEDVPKDIVHKILWFTVGMKWTTPWNNVVYSYDKIVEGKDYWVELCESAIVLKDSDGLIDYKHLHLDCLPILWENHIDYNNLIGKGLALRK